MSTEMWYKKDLKWGERPYGRKASDPQDSEALFIQIYSGLDTGRGAELISGLRDHTKVETVTVLGYTDGPMEYGSKVEPSDFGLSSFGSVYDDFDGVRPLLHLGKKQNGSEIKDYYAIGQTFHSVKENGDGRFHILRNVSGRTLALRIKTGAELTSVKRS